VIAGLVTITPGSGFVAPRRFYLKTMYIQTRSNNSTVTAVLYGVLGATIRSMTTRLFNDMGIDDS